MKYEEVNVEINEAVKTAERPAETIAAAESAEAAEQRLMDASAEQAVSEEEMLEQQEMNEGAKKLGYSSSYYESEMANALNSGNRIAYENARRNWANAKAREATH